MVRVGETRYDGTPDDAGKGGSAPIDNDEFADRFQASYRVFWLIAMSVVRDVELAEDVVQEAAVIGLRKRNAYTPGTNFDAWIGTMVRNVARNRARKERRIRTSLIQPGATSASNRAAASDPWTETPVERQVGSEAEIGSRPLASEVDGNLRQWLDEVGEVARACLILRTLEGLDYAEISRLLQIPEGTAMSHVHRTRRFLRQKLSAATTDQGGKDVAE